MATIRNSRQPSRQTSKQAEARRCTEAFRDLLAGFRAELESQLGGTGVTLAQLRMLNIIDRQENLSAAAIARACQLTPQTLQSMLTRATREGWIERGSSERSARILTAALTPRGRAILTKGMQLAKDIEEHIWQGVPLAALRTMRKTVERGLANLRGE